jgi:transposase
MKTELLKIKLTECIQQNNKMSEQKIRSIATDSIEVLGKFLYNLVVPSTWHLQDIEKIEHHTLKFHWDTQTEQATCPVCNAVSHTKSGHFNNRIVQDLPIAGMTVYHVSTVSRYNCENNSCKEKTFCEQFLEISEKDARMTKQLSEFVVRYALETSNNGASRTLSHIGIRLSTDTINRAVKRKGALVIAENLKRDDVKVLSVDDINLRKGNSSTACSVFIDAETHRVLIIVQGSSSEVASKVMGEFTCVKMVSRDRGTAYSAAAKKFLHPQVADGFHLIQNIHETIKNALYWELPHDVFVTEGDGWIRTVDSSCENIKTDDELLKNQDGLMVIKPAILAADDIENRIMLAGLTQTQAQKYKYTFKILELLEQGIRTPEIAKRLAIAVVEINRYRNDAPETIKNAEQRIDEYYEMHKKGQWEYHQKTIAKNARPVRESIVEPYKETVLKMFNEKKSHREIHPVLVEEGFTGSANAIYQYLIKYAFENNIPFGRNSRVIAIEERNEIPSERPARISIERVARDNIYKAILKNAAGKRDEMRQSMDIPNTLVTEAKIAQIDSTKVPINNTNYSEDIAKIIFDTSEKVKNVKKKLNNSTLNKLKNKHKIISHLMIFLFAFYEIFILSDIHKLDAFIKTYKNDSNAVIVTFASGLLKDYDAIKNCLIYTEISNGPMEGTNNKIKMIRRRGYGRAGLELLNALVVLPWYYYDIDKQAQEKLLKVAV